MINSDQEILLIYNAFVDKHNCRLKIIRFLAKEAKEEEYAKTRKQIASELDITQPAALEHLDALQDIGVIVQTRSEDNDNKERYQGPREVIKYYLNIKNLIELKSILNAAMLGLPNDAAIKIKKAITKSLTKV
jgi:DNA-binding transcriptional ArsR family regulator